MTRRVVVQAHVDVNDTLWTVRASLDGDSGAVLTVSGPAPGSPWIVAVNIPSCRVKTNESLPVDAVYAVAKALREGPIHDRLWPTATLELVR